MVYLFGGEKKKAVLLTIQCESPNLSGQGGWGLYLPRWENKPLVLVL